MLSYLLVIDRSGRERDIKSVDENERELFLHKTFSHIAAVIFQTSSSSNASIPFTRIEKESEGKKKKQREVGERERECSLRCFGNLDERT